MKFFIDTEFLEGPQKKKFLGITYGETKPTIDFISIGIVPESKGIELSGYYAISKEFNIDEAWDRWDGEYHELTGFERDQGYSARKKYWIRENVLFPIFKELATRYEYEVLDLDFDYSSFTKSNFKFVVNRYGKTRKQIASEIIDYVFKCCVSTSSNVPEYEFYGYYSDYDWVVFCWLFGKMKDLPKGFPMFCIDLKQMLDDKVNVFCRGEVASTSFQSALSRLKRRDDYPKQNDEHNAFSDAKWNYELYKFIKNLNWNK